MPYKPENLTENILINYRWVFVCLFLLPVSFVYDILIYFRSWIVFTLNSAPKQHDKKVKFVQKQVADWNKNGKNTQMCTARPGWQMMSFRKPRYKNTMKHIEVNLVDILEVDIAKQVVRVEPLVSMGQLTAALIPIGWTIPIVPEIDDLTVGGLIMGTGIETSSHIHGLFQHICISYELVLADGSLTKCSAKENPDLFYSVPWSYGTLGFLTAVEIKLIPAKKYVKLNYTPIKSIDVLLKEFQAASRSSQYDFVEVLVYNKDESVLMTGNQIDEVESEKVNAIGEWYKPWFFAHVQNFLKINKTGTEYIPLRDYYHRHTRSIFWEIQDVIPFGNNILFRFLLGWMIPPKISLLKLTQTNSIKKLYENNHIIQDMLVPIEELKRCIDVFHTNVAVYPLWVCPFKLPQNPGMVHPPRSLDKSPKMYVDVGCYGVPKVDHYKPKESTRRIEKFVSDVHGFQMLYADTFMTKEEFRKMFDHTLYDKLRQQLDCKTAFPEVYDKVSKAARI